MSGFRPFSIESSGGTGTTAYSTTETMTNRKWIDGKDIYEVTIDLTGLSVNGGVILPAGTVDTVASVIGVVERTTSPRVFPGIMQAFINIEPNGSVVIYNDKGFADNFTGGQLTVQYTKV